MNQSLTTSLLVAPALLGVASANGAEEREPNIIFILVDDLAYDAIESTGRYPFLETPNITRLQNQGVTFNNFFCTLSLSSPSRASFLTGVYPHIHGVNQNDKRVDANWAQYPSYPAHLQKAGYQTAFIGKIHGSLRWLEDQVRPGFDYWLGFRGQGDYFKNDFNENGREFSQEGYVTDVLTDYAEEWIREGRDKSKPFSMCLWHKVVHGPFTPAERHSDSYLDETLPEPPYGNGIDLFEGKPDWLKRKKEPDLWNKTWKFEDYAASNPKWEGKNKQFFNILRTLRAVDDSVGRVLDLLVETGDIDNTIILFSSDNGYFMGEHGLHDKRIAYEESMRLPMIISYPKMIKPKTTAEPICLNIDVAPTLLELAGVEVPSYMQGDSFAEVLKGNNNPKGWRKSFLFEYYVDDEYPYAGPTMVAVRTEQYKLIDVLDPDIMDELYDIKSDRGEMVNLINSKRHKSILKELYAECERLKSEYKYNEDRDFWLREVAPHWTNVLSRRKMEYLQQLKR